jgi:CheY-like chemotaxis protein
VKNKRFLVVEDEKPVADFVRTVIELEGGVVVLAGTGTEAFARLRSDGPFDLMVMDLALPDRSGWDLLASAREILGACKVVVFSAQLSTEHHERARKAGVALSLAKPVAATTLRDALRSALSPDRGP